MRKPNRQVTLFEHDLETARMKGHVNFRDKYLDEYDGSMFLCVNCPERDVDRLINQMDVSKFESISFADTEETDTGRFIVKYKIEGLESR